MTAPKQTDTVCTLAEAVAHLDDKRPRKVRQAEPRCGPLVECRCNMASCCVCVYSKAQHLCHYVSEPKPCR